MKSHAIILATLFAATSALPLAAVAASDNPDEAKAEQSAGKKLKPHSHVQEKTGAPQNMMEPRPDKPNPTKDKSRHFHPRDAK